MTCPFEIKLTCDFLDADETKRRVSEVSGLYSRQNFDADRVPGGWTQTPTSPPKVLPMIAFFG